MVKQCKNPCEAAVRAMMYLEKAREQFPYTTGFRQAIDSAYREIALWSEGLVKDLDMADEARKQGGIRDESE